MIGGSGETEQASEIATQTDELSEWSKTMLARDERYEKDSDLMKAILQLLEQPWEEDPLREGGLLPKPQESPASVYVPDLSAKLPGLPTKYDQMYGAAIFACLIVLTALPLSDYQSNNLFAANFATLIAERSRRRQLVAELLM